MAILVSDIISRVAAQIDAEGSEFYLPTQDYIPAIRSAQDFVVGVINSQLGRLKFSEEIFKDLSRTRVWQTSAYSRIDIGLTGDQVWSITDVVPLPTTVPAFAPVVLPNPEDSALRTDLSHLKSLYYASRLSFEEWENNIENPFAQGHQAEAGEVPRSFAYLNYSNYGSTNYFAGPEIEIRPEIPHQPLTIRYTKVPLVPTLVIDSLEFPKFVTEIIVAATANFMSYKQGDQTTLNQLSSQLLSMLFAENT